MRISRIATRKIAGEAWNLGRRSLIPLFTLGGATLGLLVGVYEAALLHSTPRIPALLKSDVRYVIWFLAPLIGLVLFSLLGAALGLAAGLREAPQALEILARASG